MSKLLIDSAVIEQAIDALNDAHRRDEHAAARWVYEEAIDSLREALDHSGEANEMVGCAYCNNPLFAGTKCNNCGLVTLADQAEQEPVAETALKNCIYFDSIDFNQTPPYLRYDTGDSTPKENWTVYRDIQDDLREDGYELTDSGVDHDTVWGYVTPIAAPQPVQQEPVGVVTDEMKVLLKEGDSPCAIAMRFGGRIGTVEYNKLYIPLEKLAEQAERVTEGNGSEVSLETEAQEPVAWQGAEEWEPLAFQLCADENGEESCNELLWDGGVIPEPWGERWLKYEDEAKRMIEYVRKYAAPVRTKDLTDDEIVGVMNKIYGSTWTEQDRDFACAVIAAYKEKNK